MNEETLQAQISKALQARISAPKMEVGDTPEMVMIKLQDTRAALTLDMEQVVQMIVPGAQLEINNG